MSKQFTVYLPGADFPAISITGTRCALRCEHCQGRFLHGMAAAETPEALLRIAGEAKERGAGGVLISGGCDASGSVPLEPFLGAITRLHREGMAVNVHTGLLDAAQAQAVVSTGADIISLDLLQDQDAIRGPLHLGAAPADYEGTLRALVAAGGTVVPHVCVGLQSPDGEDRCAELLSRANISAAVALALMPPPGRSPLPGLEDRLVRFVEKASSLGVAVLVGCMRSRGAWEAEVRCIEAGAVGMASPSPRTVQWARENGYTVEERRTCCALHR